MNRFVILSGCSGGGKSSLLEELRRRGHAVIDEPGRRIVAEELAGDGAALPWNDLPAFARRAIALSIADRAAMSDRTGWIFFDRGLVDAAAALAHATGDERMMHDLCGRHRYHDRVFLTPPWPEIYVKDDARQHAFAEAVAEYERLCAVYPALGYEPVILPKTSVSKRADFLLARLSA
ncbi:AAA family ATPase [Rhizobium sp. SGZ-381]|uniref:AAA family ATPase n=1 Tax=Rhizobium sp. SGZ-381 TaxID=3342800 RepID=UPI00366B13B0